MGEPASHQEILDVKEQLSGFGNKLDSLTAAVNLMHNMLSEAKGANLPSRLGTLETKFEAMKEEHDKRTALSSQVESHAVDIKSLWKFVYMVTGALIFLQVVSAFAGKFLLDKIFP